MNHLSIYTKNIFFPSCIGRVRKISPQKQQINYNKYLEKFVRPMNAYPANNEFYPFIVPY